MFEPGAPTFDQLRVFLTVIEAGSFAAAGRRLHRATSVVSYTIASLEAQLGVILFDRDASKRPRLSEAGRMVLAESRAIASGVDGLNARIKSMRLGLEAEVRIALDVMLPMPRLVGALNAFRAAYPSVTLNMQVEALGAVTQRVLDRTATLGVGGPMDVGAEDLERIALGAVALIPVAAPGHPLARPGPVSPGAARQQVQLVLSDRSTLTQGQEFAVVATRVWRLSDLASKHGLLLAGLGWGNMPEPMVRDDIAAGRLVALDLPEPTARDYPLQAIYRRDTPLGPAATFLIEAFRRQDT